MELADLITSKAILANVKASGRKQALQAIGHRAADVYGLNCGAVVHGLLSREKLGSTAMGTGVAIPHARLSGLDRIVGLFARFEKPIDFEAADGQGVDLMFALLAPEEADADHLRVLAKVSRLMRDKGLRGKLRTTKDADSLHALITDVSASRAA